MEAPPEKPAPEPASRPWAALFLGFLSLLGSLFPFVGFLGAIPLALAWRRRGAAKKRLRRWTVALGGTSMALALGWAVVYLEPPRAVVQASCPRVQSFDGAEYRLSASFAAGSLYPWAERLDVARADNAAAVAGEVRFRVQNELQEVDQIDSFELWTVDHEKGSEILPTVNADLIAVNDAQAPLRAVDSTGANVLPQVLAADGRSLEGAVRTGSDGEPRQSWSFDFPRPPGNRALLVLRARGTAFAEQAFSRYLALMGQGMGPFMAAVEKDDCEPCSQAQLREELDLLHIPLVITVAPDSPSRAVHTLAPIGPAALRSFVLPIELRAGEPSGTVTVRIDSTPRFWEIDYLALAADSGAAIAPAVSKPKSATLGLGERHEDVLAQLMFGDRARVAVHPGETLDVSFAAPAPPAGLARSFFLALRAHYEVPVGGHRLINAAAVLSHRLGLRSLPRFAATLP